MSERAESLLVTLQDGIKRITLNRPERRNSVDGATVRLLLAAFKDAADDGTRVVILTGAGESFCAGADLSATSASDIANFDITTSLRERINPTILAMRALPVPVIARVHGHAVGVGCNFALACDLIIASEQALFGQVFVKIGLMPDGGGTYFLPRLVGYHKKRTDSDLSTASCPSLNWTRRLTRLPRGSHSRRVWRSQRRKRASIMARRQI